jgi:hypothetical protein
MSIFFLIKAAQGFAVPAKRDRKAYTKYAAAGNPRRTPSRTKRAILGWTLIRFVNYNKDAD